MTGRILNSNMKALQPNCLSSARTGRSSPYAAQNSTQHVIIRINTGDARALLGKGVYRGERRLLSRPCSAAGDFGESAALESGLSKHFVSMVAQMSISSRCLCHVGTSHRPNQAPMGLPGATLSRFLASKLELHYHSACLNKSMSQLHPSKCHSV